MTNVLLLSRIKAATANAHDSTLFQFGPKLTAAFGLLDALTFSNNGQTKHNRVERFCYVHHHCDPKGMNMYGFTPQQRRGALYIDRNDYSGKNNSPGALSLQPTSSMDVEVSLIAVYEKPFDLDAIRQRLDTGRFAGGRIDSYDAAAYASEDEALAAIPSGFVVVDRKDLVRPGEEMESLMDALTRIRNPRYAGDDPWPSFLTPAVVGYALLNEPRVQSGSVRGQKHAFAEPLIGIAQYVSKNACAVPAQQLCWEHAFDPEKQIWVLQQQEPVLVSEEFDDLEIDIA